MNTHRSSWWLVLALITQLLSPAANALGINDHGIWSVSCAGKLQLLPLPGEEPLTHPGAAGDCTLCCDEPRGSPDTATAPTYPDYDSRSTDSFSSVPSTAGTAPGIKSHLTRAPPHLQ